MIAITESRDHALNRVLQKGMRTQSPFSYWRSIVSVDLSFIKASYIRNINDLCDQPDWRRLDIILAMIVWLRLWSAEIASVNN